MPTKDHVRRENRADLGQSLAPERFAEHREHSPLAIGKPDPLAPDLFTEHPVLFSEVVDHALLLVVEDPSNENTEKLPWVELGTHRARIR